MPARVVALLLAPTTRRLQYVCRGPFQAISELLTESQDRTLLFGFTTPQIATLVMECLACNALRWAGWRPTLGEQTQSTPSTQAYYIIVCSTWTEMAACFDLLNHLGKLMKLTREKPAEKQIFLLDVQYVGNFDDYELIKQWSIKRCIPLVREMTFENVEGLTEEGLPFLIFFRDPKAKKQEKIFTEAVARELDVDQRMTVNPLLADGIKFAHPLRILGKSTDDLPVLAIDSFAHMFLFPNVSELSTPGVLKKFVDDLHSGALHREFHANAEARQKELDDFQEQYRKAHGEERLEEVKKHLPTVQKEIPKSAFKDLKPSRRRYSFSRKTEL